MPKTLTNIDLHADKEAGISVRQAISTVQVFRKVGARSHARQNLIDTGHFAAATAGGGTSTTAL